MTLNNGAVAAIVFTVVVFMILLSSGLFFWYCVSCCVARVSTRPNHPDPPFPYRHISVRDLAFHVDKEKQQAFIETRIIASRFMRFFMVPGHDCENLSRASPCPAAPQKPISPNSEQVVPITTHTDHNNGIIVDSQDGLSSLDGPSTDPQAGGGSPPDASKQEQNDSAHPLVIDIFGCHKYNDSTHASIDNDTFGVSQTIDHCSRASDNRRRDLDGSSSSCNEENVAAYLFDLENELLQLQCQDGQPTKIVARDTLLFNLHTYGHMRLGEQILEAEDSIGGGYIPLRGVVVVQSKTVVSLEDIAISPGDLICVMQFIETVPQNGVGDESAQLTPDIDQSKELCRPRMTCSGYLLNVCVEQNGQHSHKIIPRPSERGESSPLWVSEIPVEDVSRL